MSDIVAVPLSVLCMPAGQSLLAWVADTSTARRGARQDCGCVAGLGANV